MMAAVKPNVSCQVLTAAAESFLPTVQGARSGGTRLSRGCRQQTDSREMGARQRKQQPQRQREMIPRQREGLVYAVVVDQFDLERPVGVQRQPASREHQVDLELVGCGGGEMHNCQPSL